MKDMMKPSSRKRTMTLRLRANSSPRSPEATSSRLLMSLGRRVRSFKYPMTGMTTKENRPPAETIKDISVADLPMPVRYTESTELNRAMARK